MEKTAMIWRKSVYKNEFKCNRCALQLADSAGKLLEGKTRLGTRFGKPFVFCRRCGNPVMRIEKVDVPEEMGGLQGDYTKFKKGKKKRSGKEGGRA